MLLFGGDIRMKLAAFDIRQVIVACQELVVESLNWMDKVFRAELRGRDIKLVKTGPCDIVFLVPFGSCTRRDKSKLLS